MKTGIVLIAKERERQIDQEDWTPEHDDEHGDGSLALAAATYAMHGAGIPLQHLNNSPVPAMWPWDAKWWKPKDPIRDLVRAGALIAAEIDRLQRRGAENGEGAAR